MKLTRTVLSGLACVSLAAARELLPERWFENVPSADGAIQQSLVFRTVAGVHYEIETSENLSVWSKVGEIYGLGHEFVVAMREFTPPPPLPPGENPPTPPPNPAVHASVMLRPSNGVGGGTVASWRSLDSGGPVVVLLEDELHQDWANMPCYWQRHGDHYFIIGHTSHQTSPPPDEFHLGPQDVGLLAQLEASLPEMNQHVATAVATSRNTPLPPPPSAGSRKFWRIRADWSMDTDGDETPDWAEFEIGADDQHPSHAFADAFVADIDGNGVADGLQMDLDQDGVADAIDTSLVDALADQVTTAVPRFAVFPVARPAPTGVTPPPISINDRGTILWNDGFWTDAAWQPLVSGTGGLATYGAVAQNDHGEIVGNGQWTIPAAFPGLTPVTVKWESPFSNPAAILLEGTDEDAGKVFHGPIVGDANNGPLFSNDGRVIAATSYYKVSQSGSLQVGTQDDGQPSIWTLPGSGRTLSRVTLDHGFAHTLDGDTYWGYNVQTEQVMFQAPGNPPPPDRAPRNLVRSSTGLLHAFYNVASPRILKDGIWDTSINLLNGIDMAVDGTAIAAKIGSTVAPLQLNGKWQPIANTIPGATDWKDNTVSLLDTSSGGWILAKRGDPESPLYGALLPLRVKGNREVDGTVLQDAVGVDDFSIRSSAPGEAVADKIWIMAPSHGGETHVKVFAPIHASCPVELSSTGIEFNGAGSSVTLTQAETVFSITASNATVPGSGIPLVVPGSEIPLVIKLGTGKTAQSFSSPISFKAMKQRTVRVRVWKVKGDNGELPSFSPTKEELENHLNKIFKFQINAIFDCNLETIGPLNYDTANATVFGAPTNQSALVEPDNGILDFTEDFAGEMSIIRVGGHVTTFNINLYIVGGSHWVAARRWDAEGSKIATLKAQAIANRNEENTRRECWIPGESITPADGLQTIAHEIGHILFGDGHPENNTGPAPLPSTPRPPRLMCSDPKLRAIGGLRRLTVKGEWDEVVEWFKLEIRDNRMPQ